MRSRSRCRRPCVQRRRTSSKYCDMAAGSCGEAGSSVGITQDLFQASRCRVRGAAMTGVQDGLRNSGTHPTKKQAHGQTPETERMPECSACHTQRGRETPQEMHEHNYWRKENRTNALGGTLATHFQTVGTSPQAHVMHDVTSQKNYMKQ